MTRTGARASILLLLLKTATASNTVQKTATAGNTVQSWVYTATDNWPRARDFFLTGAAQGAVNAVSCGGLIAISENGDLITNQANLDAHTRIWRPTPLRTYPCLGVGGNITVLRSLFAPDKQPTVIAQLANLTRDSGFDGLNLDFEPLTNVHDPRDPFAPTTADAAALAKFVDALAKALHALPGRPELQLDTLSIAEACWNTPDNGHMWDLKPCPWIRRFWDFDALALTELDTVIPMDSYGRNETQFPWMLQYYQRFFDIDRIGWGLHPIEVLNSPAFVTSRMGPFTSYTSKRICVWAWGDVASSGGTIEAMEARWAPWIPAFKKFLAAGGRTAPPPPPKAAAVTPPPKPVPTWTFRAPVSVTAMSAQDIFHDPPLYANWTLINYYAMDNATQRGAWTRMDTTLGPIPGEYAFWSVNCAARPQTQLVNFPLGSSTCKVFNITKGSDAFPQGVFNFNTGFDDFLYSQSKYQGVVTANGGKPYQKWVTVKGGGDQGDRYDCEYHINADGEFAYIQWKMLATIDGVNTNKIQLDVRSTFGPYEPPKEEDFQATPNITCVPSPAPSPPMGVAAEWW